MCILRFHAWAGYLQTYETLLKEINMHPGSAQVDNNQYLVESVALSDSNFNLACETRILYPSLVAMLNRQSMMWRTTVIFHDVYEYLFVFGAYQYIPVCTGCILVHTGIFLVCTLIVL